jgi:hypothetical protein
VRPQLRHLSRVNRRGAPSGRWCRPAVGGHPALAAQPRRPPHVPPAAARRAPLLHGTVARLAPWPRPPAPRSPAARPAPPPQGADPAASAKAPERSSGGRGRSCRNWPAADPPRPPGSPGSRMPGGRRAGSGWRPRSGRTAMSRRSLATSMPTKKGARANVVLPDDPSLSDAGLSGSAPATVRVRWDIGDGDQRIFVASRRPGEHRPAATGWPSPPPPRYKGAVWVRRAADARWPFGDQPASELPASRVAARLRSPHLKGVGNESR